MKMKGVDKKSLDELSKLATEIGRFEKLNRDMECYKDDRTSVKTEKAKSYNTAQNNASKAQKTPPKPKRERLAALKYMADLRIPLIGAYSSGAMIDKQEPENFTTDKAEIAALMAGKGNKKGRAKGIKIQRFYFIPEAAGLLCLDIDRKPGKVDGLKELYKLFPKDTLPRALQDIERFFPCYVKTPSGGYHLYFKYSGKHIPKIDLCPEVEVKHGKPGLTAPGSRKENGDYVLYGVIKDAPPLYGIIIDRINELLGKVETKAKANHHAAHSHKAMSGNRITLDTLAKEAADKYPGNHDRQVCFAGKVCRLQEAAQKKDRDYGDFTEAKALAYVKAHPEIFGEGTDTENTIKSVFTDNGRI